MKLYAEFDTSYGHRLTVTQSSNACYAGTWLHIKKEDTGPAGLPAVDLSINMTEEEVQILIAALQNN